MAQYSILHTFYASDTWRNFRLSLIVERGNVCQHCGRVIPRAIDIIGHHTIELTPENVNDHTISLNPALVELICFDCHNQEHQRFGYQSKMVYIVYGPPMSGMDAFVRSQMKRGDLVVNMDELYAAVSLLPHYDKPETLYANVIGIHNQLLDNIKTRLGKWRNAWVIGGYAERFKRERIANDLGAELIFCESTRDECISRLHQDEMRQYRIPEWTKYIDKWFEMYS